MLNNLWRHSLPTLWHVFVIKLKIRMKALIVTSPWKQITGCGMMLFQCQEGSDFFQEGVHPADITRQRNNKCIFKYYHTSCLCRWQKLCISSAVVIEQVSFTSITRQRWFCTWLEYLQPPFNCSFKKGFAKFLLIALQFIVQTDLAKAVEEGADAPGVLILL